MAAGLSTLVVALVRHLGGFTLESTPSGFSSVQAMGTHFWWTLQGVLALFGADIFSLSLSAATGLVLLHLVGLTLAVIAVVRGVRDFLRTDDLLIGVLTAAVVINLGLYLFMGLAVTIWSAREIAGILPAAAVSRAGRSRARSSNTDCCRSLARSAWATWSPSVTGSPGRSSPPRGRTSRAGCRRTS